MNNRNSFIIMLAVCLLLSFITGGKTFYNTCLFLSIVLSLNYFIIRNNIKKIDSNFVINRETHVVSEEVKFKYILVNKSIIAINKLSVNLILSKDFGSILTEIEDLSFRANQIVELKRSFICEKRGYYEIGKLEVEVSDVFSFFSKERILDKSISIKVYPKVVEISKIDMQLNGFLGNIKSNKSSLDDFTNIKSIREYVIGDNPKNIDHKLSAKSNKTFVKEYYDSNYLDLIIIVDAFGADKYANKSEEKCISTSLSICKYALEHAGEIQYMLNSKSVLNMKLRDISEFNNLLEEVVTSVFDGENTLSSYLSCVLSALRKKSDFIIITRSIDKLVTGQILNMIKSGSNIILYIVDYIETQESKNLILKLEANNVKVYFIDHLEQL